MKKKLQDFFDSVGKKVNTPKGWIYFITTDSRPKAVKIGFTTRLKHRMAAIQTANSDLLILYGAVPACREDEKYIHTLLAPWNIRGEWFECDEDSIECIKNTTYLFDNLLKEGNKKNRLNVKREHRAPGQNIVWKEIMQSDGGSVPKPFNYIAYGAAKQVADSIEDDLLADIDARHNGA